jgi:hypothetical protein
VHTAPIKTCGFGSCCSISSSQSKHQIEGNVREFVCLIQLLF